ncbi:MAG: hypothetical protein WCI71_15850, partial [Bacteroidota bacterium]
ADDFHYYLVARRGLIFADSLKFAQIAGRFYLYLVKPISGLPYIVDNPVIINLFQYIPLIFCFLGAAKILLTVTKSKEMAILYLLVFLLIMQVSKHTNLMVSYPFYFSFSFLLLLLSVLLLLRYYGNKKKRLLIYSSLLFAVALLFYETYIFFLVFAAIIVISSNFKTDDKKMVRIKKSCFQFSPFLLVGVIYLIIYFVYRIYYPSQYAGTSFATKTVNFSSFFTVIWRLAYSSFPLTVYETSHNIFWDKSEMVTGYSPVLLNLLLRARVEWIVKGILVSWVGYKLLDSVPPIKLRTLFAGFGISVLLIFMPHIPLALTEKYTFCVENGDMIGYVTTFFSLFGTLLLITILLTYLVNLFNFNLTVKRVVIAVMVLGFYICSILTDFSNYYIAKDIRRANLRLYAVDELIKTDEFKSIPPNSPFYARDMYNNPSYSAASLTEQMFNWFEYLEAKTGVYYPLGREAKIFLDYSKNLSQVPYFLTMRQAEKSEDVSLVMAQMKPLQPQDSVVNHFADRALILYYSNYKYFTVSFRIKGDPPGINIPIRVNQIVDQLPFDKTVEFTIYDTKKGHAATSFIVQIPGIDLNSILISNMVKSENKIFYL